MSTFRDGRYRALFTVMYQCGLRLISVTVNTVTTAYSYDAKSRRTSKQVDSTPAIYYLYDGWNMIADYTIDDSSSPIQNSYSWGMDLSGSMQGSGGVGGLLAVTDHGSESTAHFFPTYDGNGNVSEYLDASGAMQAHYEYDPFGDTTVSTGDKATDFFHRFSTKPLDAETGLYYYGYRYYDPVTGRWPSRDPIEERGGINLYGFAYNASVDHWDFAGLSILGGDAVEIVDVVSMLGALSPCPKCPKGAEIQPRYVDAILEGSDCNFEYKGQTPGDLDKVVSPSKSNACTGIIDGIPGVFNFTAACVEHDKCYSLCGKTQVGCDTEFLANMLTSCASSFRPTKCRDIAIGFHATVSTLPKVAQGFKDAQKYWCQWKPCCDDGHPSGSGFVEGEISKP